MIVEHGINIANTSISIIRDDLFPMVGGGNKARKAAFYEAEFKANGYNAAVTTGGIQSNHNRAIALMCAKIGWKCHIVFHGTRERFEREKGNALLVRLSGADVEFVEANQIGPAMDKAMARFSEQGLKPYYVTGGGHNLPGGCALVEAVRELKAKCDAIGYKPAYIFHASGTGSTQAGIAVGLHLVGWDDVKVIGISVARNKTRGIQVIKEFADMLNQHYENCNYPGEIHFSDDYLMGGYECTTPECEAFLKFVTQTTGIAFDTTYSGKALYGMSQYIKANNISGPIMFWHTGGLMNLMK